MNNTTISKTAALLAASLFAGGLINLQADTLIDFDGTGYVSADQDFQHRASNTPNPTDPYTYTLAYSDSNPISPSSGYSGPTFYGGFQYTSTTIAPSSGISRQEVRNNYQGADQIVLKATNFPDDWTGSELSLHAVFIFKQTAFDPGYTTGNLTVDGLSVNWGSVDVSASFSLTGYFLVQTADTFYLSNTTFDMSSDGVFSLDATALASETWAVYDPASDLNFDQSSATYNSLVLEEITAVGIYYEDDVYDGGTNTSAFDVGIKTFNATGTVIPEPSQITFLLCLGSLLCIWRKRSVRMRS